jgi:Lysyl oxidase
MRMFKKMLLALGLAAAFGAAHAATDLLPTLTSEASVLADADVVYSPPTGRILLRFANGIGNRGLGPMHLIGYRDPNAVIDPDNTFHDEVVGSIVYHDEHHHFHYDGASRFRLIEKRGNREVIVAESSKVSFCLADVGVVDATLPGYPTAPRYNSCLHNASANSVLMGISVGWDDIYGKDLQGQAFDVTDLMALPIKEYILETTSNPYGFLWEANRKKPSSARITILLGVGVPIGTGVTRPGV